MSCKLDLHTHSYGSPDGGLTLRDYRYFLQNNLLDYVAITDHNSIETALSLQDALGDLGSRIIIGEEIMTTSGEIIGLYLSETIPAGLTPAETVSRIRQQDGLVYIPHPFETVRSGMTAKRLDEIAADVDIIEISNGRAIFQNREPQARAWAQAHDKPGAASSDTHGRLGWGQTYSVIDNPPTRQNLASQLLGAAYSRRKVGIGALYPKLNRMRGRAQRGSV